MAASLPPAASNPLPTERTGAKYDVFLSYNSRERDLVMQIRDKLMQQNLDPFMDVSGLEQGGDFSANLKAHMDQCQSCAVFIGAHGFGRYHEFETTYAGNQSINNPDFPTFPVFLPGCPDNPGLSAYLLTRSRIDFRANINDPETLQQLICAIRREPYRPITTVMAAVGECPYQGLEAFDETKQRFFFGRAEDVRRLVDKLKESRFLAVVGASGSGKSSVVKAGLVPTLHAAGLPASQTWDIRVFTPGKDPLTSLAVQFVPFAAPYAIVSEATLLDQMVTDMQANERGLHNTVTVTLAKVPAVERALFVVDQFEEVFTLCGDETTRRQFIDNLVYAATAPSGKCIVVLTMRADFYARCTGYRNLADLLGTHQYIVSPMDEAGLREAIEKPAQAVGLTLQAGLVRTILNDIEGQPGNLPLLQYALSELWRKRDGTMLTLRGYQESGGVTGAMAKRAEAIYTGFTPQQQEIARRTLLRLTQPGEGSEDTRRRADLSELVTRPEEENAVETVVQALADARLLTTGTGNTGSDTQGATAANSTSVEVAHEALIRGWDRLHTWINEDRDLLRIRGRITEAAEEWDRTGQRPDYLYRSVRLAEATEKRAALDDQLNPLERAFLDASVAQQTREHLLARRRTERLIGGLVMAAVIFSLLALFGFVQSGNATAQRNVAEQEREVADTQRATAEAQKLVAQGARGVADAKSNAAATSAAVADTQKRVAEAAQAQADTERNNAVTQRNAANQARDDAERQRKAAAAGEMAANALTLRDTDPELSLILATHAMDQAPDNAQAQYALRAALAASHVRATIRHNQEMYHAEFSPDGKRIQAVGSGSYVRVWNAATGVEVLAAGISNNKVGAQQALAFSPDGTRIVYGRPTGDMQIWDAATDTLIVKFIGHTGVINTAVFSPDSKRVLTASGDGTARIWDALTGKELQRFTHMGRVWSAAFNRDATRVATASVDKTARIWDADTGMLQQTFIHPDLVGDVAFSPDGTRIVTSCGDKIARIWDVRTVAVVQTSLEPATGVFMVAYSPDGRSVITNDGPKTARVWDPNTGKTLHILTGHENGVYSAVFSPDGTRIVTASLDGTARIWETTTGKLMLRMTGDAFPVIGVAFTAEGRRAITTTFAKVTVSDIATGNIVQTLGNTLLPIDTVAYSSDRTRVVMGESSGTKSAIEVGDLNTGKVMRQIMLPDAFLRAVAITDNGRRVIAVGTNGTATIWDVDTGDTVGTLNDLPDITYGAAFSPNGMQVVLSGYNLSGSLVQVWAVNTGMRVRTLGPFTTVVIKGVGFSPDGKLIVATGVNGAIQTWDATTGNEARSYQGHSVTAFGAAFSADSLRLVSASVDGTARIWDVATGKPILTLSGHQGGVQSAVFSADGTQVITGGADGTTRVWDVAPYPQILPVSKHDKPIDAVAFSPDGTLTATTGLDGTLQIHDAITGNLVRTLMGEGPMLGGAFSPDGKLLITAVYRRNDGGNGFAQLWDVATGSVVRGFTTQSTTVRSVALSPDGKLLATVGEDASVRIWNAMTGAQVQVFDDYKIIDDIPDTLTYLSFSPDSTRLVTAGSHGNTIVRDLRTGKSLVFPLSQELSASQLGASVVESAVFSPDGTRVLTAHDDGLMRLWDIASGMIIFTVSGSGGPINHAVFSHDGKFLAVAEGNGTVRLLLAETGEEISQVHKPGAPVNRVAFSPDDAHVLIAQGNEA